jgi:hypothetical protein
VKTTATLRLGRATRRKNITLLCRNHLSRPFRAWFCGVTLTQGCAMGYQILPLQGLKTESFLQSNIKYQKANVKNTERKLKIKLHGKTSCPSYKM